MSLYGITRVVTKFPLFIPLSFDGEERIRQFVKVKQMWKTGIEYPRGKWVSYGFAKHKLDHETLAQICAFDRIPKELVDYDTSPSGVKCYNMDDILTQLYSLKLRNVYQQNQQNQQK